MTADKKFIIKDNSSIKYFENSFGTLHDAQVHRVQANLFSPDFRNKSIEVSLSAIRWDIDVESIKERWVNLDLYFVKVQEFEIIQTPNETIAFITEASYEMRDDNIYIDFFTHNESQLNVVAKYCEWSIFPYVG